MIHQRRLRPIACAAALLAAGTPLQAQDAGPQRVEITGSSIKRLEGETALPVTVIRREDIEKTGSTTAAEVLAKVSASAANLTDGASFSDIPGQRGFAGANLRGIGVSSTLVLLNGRRLANFASPGGASGVDLNAIPAAAIDRVEVLKDGASAIYGTDAIGGVVNFITRRDYQGVDVYLYGSDTQHGGAGKAIATLSGGLGDLGRDGYNLFAVLDLQDTKTLRSTQRDWIRGSFVPELGLDVASSNTFPANVRELDEEGFTRGPRRNPSAPGCNPPATLYDPESFVGDLACYYDYMQDTEIFPASKRQSLITRGQLKLGADHVLFAEALISKTKTTYRISPLTVTDLDYPEDGEFYPASADFDVSGPLRMNWRLAEAGGRTNEVDATATRFVLGVQGTLAGWDYDTALNHSESKVTDAYVGGYVRTSLFDAAVATGKINPFGPSGAEGQALLRSALIRDDARKSKGTTDTFDIKGSRELFAMGGGAAAMALGFEARREKMNFTPSALLEAGEIRGDSAATAFGGKRDVTAVYAELNLPWSKTLETQLALRHDRYDDVGSTTNPKAGVRWSPLPQLVVRGSAGTGFRAPSLADLYTPERLGQTNGIYDDPLGCEYVKANAPDFEPDYCGLQPDKLRGGSPELKPEKSKQFSLGFVVEPMAGLSASLDWWRIEKTNVIVSAEGVYFSDPARYAQYITRGDPFDELPADIPGPIVEIDSRLRNIGALKTSGIDLGLEWRGQPTAFGRFGATFNGTYVIDYETQEDEGGPFSAAVGKFANDQVIQRWRHTVTFDWSAGPWSAALTQTFLRGYTDQQLLPDGNPRRVSDYTLWDLVGTWAPGKAWKLRAGVKNLLDTNPPFSNQLYSFLASYDANYTDPRGRSFFASVQYAFR